MVIPYIRLWERRIDQVIRGGIHPFQKVFGIKLVIWLEMVDFCIFQFYILHILGKVRLVIVPEYQLAGVTGKFRIQAVYDLF